METIEIELLRIMKHLMRIFEGVRSVIIKGFETDICVPRLRIQMLNNTRWGACFLEQNGNGSFKSYSKISQTLVGSEVAYETKHTYLANAATRRWSVVEARMERRMD